MNDEDMKTLEDAINHLQIPLGMPLSEFIKEQKVNLAGTGIRLNLLATLAPVFEPEQGEWLAHILNVHVMDTEWSHYKFITVPDTAFLDRVNVVVLNTYKPQEEQIMGYADPAEQQPVLQKYLENIIPK